MATPVNGSFYSDLAVGAKADVSEDLLEAVPGQTPYLNTTGFGGGGSVQNVVHTYYDDSYVPLRTTVAGGGFNAAAVNITLAAAVAKPGQRIEVDGEVILLGGSVNNLLFVGCTRSVGTAPAAAHAAGARVLVLGRPEVQGAPAGAADTKMEPRPVTTYVQECERVIEVPDTVNAQAFHGRPGTPYDWQAEDMLRDIKIELENAGLFGVATAPVGSTGVAGAFDGLYERVVGTNTTAMGGVSFTQAILRAAVEGVADRYEPDMNVNAVLLCPINQAFIFNNWQQAHVQIAPGDPLIKTYGVNVQRLQVGPMLIDVIPLQRMRTVAYLYQPNYIKWLTMNPLTHEKLYRDGRRDRGMITGAYTQEIYCPEAHWVFTGVSIV